MSTESMVFLPPFASWSLTVVFSCLGGWFLYQGARTANGAADRISSFLHAVMCVAMIVMVWPWGARIPHGLQVAVLGTGAVWFVVLAVRARRMMTALKDAHHALIAALMAWMVVMPMSAPGETPESGTNRGHAAMGQMDGPAPAAVTFAVYCFVAAVVWLAEACTATGSEPLPRRLREATGHAAMSLGVCVLILAMS